MGITVLLTSTMAGPRALLLLLLTTFIILECVFAAKPKPCRYKGRKYKAGEVMVHQGDSCVTMRCSPQGKKMEPICVEACTCSRDETTTEYLTTATDPPAPPPVITDPPAPTTECDYSVYGPTHTMNLPANAECGPNQIIGGVSEIDKETILRKHNELRAKVANGLETQGSPSPQPSAANMLEMRWNSQLAEVAQGWVEQCSTSHDGKDNRRICGRDYVVGQNLYWAKSYSADTAWEAYIDRWYSEVEDMTDGDVGSFPRGSTFTHYTQIVWAQTYEVGCGLIHYEDGRYPHAKIYVCNYGPMGNTYDRPVYIEGVAASACPDGATSTDYPGLCATNL